MINQESQINRKELDANEIRKYIARAHQLRNSTLRSYAKALNRKVLNFLLLDLRITKLVGSIH